MAELELNGKNVDSVSDAIANFLLTGKTIVVRVGQEYDFTLKSNKRERERQRD